ncbi:hypothetical protein BU24DRAFT_145986 [Aaosphaeria arxii CBS 175.79]|uniref:Uncharacterized protein n=1 Tax=Aaosphaeria arxii CBS 175.79 TaxID=1450172 RepID=A0A6A5XY66_9PLEO|nr:uncharacterized protein BU24DRAFT_145986 [Aaosphaeria arxii CBS 175.79]KAF2017214.1 hypothetical protein BU24DRAFT_145986 [Aaosphaeria arxii CBS 175.79]
MELGNAAEEATTLYTTITTTTPSLQHSNTPSLTPSGMTLSLQFILSSCSPLMQPYAHTSTLVDAPPSIQVSTCVTNKPRRNLPQPRARI